MRNRHLPSGRDEYVLSIADTGGGIPLIFNRAF